MFSPEVFFRNARGRVLMHMKRSSSITGQPRLATFHQPTFEAQLLEGTRRFPKVTAIFRANVTDTKEDAHGVYLFIETAAGPCALRAAYLVACDGGNSATRERIGAVLEGDTYPQKWLVIDAIAPGHRVRAITFGCDPARPSVQVPAKGDRLRWEFLQLPGENEACLADDATISRLLRPFGFETLPAIDRKAVYAFHTRIASRWRLGRMVLAGDAAHLMPPFAGQGMNSGLRDATNLGWKLDHVLRGAAGDAVLDTYEAERKSQVAGIVALSARLGAVIMPLSPVLAALRDMAFFFINRIPPARSFIERGDFRPPTRFRRAGWSIAAAIGSAEPSCRMRRPRREALPSTRSGAATNGWHSASGTIRKCCCQMPNGSGWTSLARCLPPGTRPRSAPAPLR
jgi:3-(3-hydroxy-phenyl)propionate hydroxylase